jgi:hypothetical protein
MKLEFSRQIFVKYSNMKFHATTSSGSRDAPSGKTDEQADRNNEANSRFLQLYEQA